LQKLWVRSKTEDFSLRPFLIEVVGAARDVVGAFIVTPNSVSVVVLYKGVELSSKDRNENEL
jgi:hypothetical protein